jgi:starch synthase
MNSPTQPIAGHAIQVLFVTSEMHPLIKTGGLADVSAALPEALGALGVNCRVLMPAYPGLIEAVGAELILDGLAPFAWGPRCRVLSGQVPNSEVPIYLLDAPELYHRPGGPYQDDFGVDWPDNALRFGLLSRVAAQLCVGQSALQWRPQVLHANDWQSGLAAAYLKLNPSNAVRSVFSVHNLAFQGNFSPDWMPRLDLPWSLFAPEGLEFHNWLSFIKSGLYYSDRLTTVSPSYAKEIQTPELGLGLDGLLRHRHDSLRGILNGINPNEWDPAADPHIAQPYDQDRLDDKAANRKALSQQLGLNVADDFLLLGMVSRMTYQKGSDLVLDALPELLRRPLACVVLGSGDTELEQRWREWAARRPDRIAVHIGYNEALAHQIEAGSDAFLMPSRFEPCGLNQMYSMRYGTPPIVRRTGGLVDSVTDASPSALASSTATGVVFDTASPAALVSAVDRTRALYEQPDLWRGLQITGMGQEFSWTRSAVAYLELYRTLIPDPSTA